MIRRWNRKERRVQDRELLRWRHDYDQVQMFPEHRISSIWDWY